MTSGRPSVHCFRLSPEAEGRAASHPDPDRAALTGILFVLQSGIPWEMLPQEMGCGCGMTCWLRLRDWHEAGVWVRLRQALLDRLGEADQIDWSRASLDCQSIPAVGIDKNGSLATGANPTNRGKGNTLVQARSAILWSTEAEPRSPASSLEPTRTNRPSSRI